ncbi:hypothetical protein [Flavobacterium sp. N1994]|uniref:hypothetical protein n=1 Tax=Flavobacterium sp. N1994 TaxID=2986827 RepID=UPI002222F443|nr:hypothetical protein [Flavobacterium sp. N1994]
MAIIRHNQSLLDIAVQECGSVFAAFDLAVANEISVTEELVPGQKIIIPNSDNTFEQVANYFKKNNIVVGTKYTEPTVSFGFPEGEFPISF